jgi:hypothetical protein
MKSATVYAIGAATFFASTSFVHAQGPSGGNGAVASIPGSIVRAEPGQPAPGLISILTGSTPAGPNADPRKDTTRSNQAPAPK